MNRTKLFSVSVGTIRMRTFRAGGRAGDGYNGSMPKAYAKV